MRPRAGTTEIIRIEKWCLEERDFRFLSEFQKRNNLTLLFNPIPSYRLGGPVVTLLLFDQLFKETCFRPEYIEGLISSGMHRKNSWVFRLREDNPQPCFAERYSS